MFQRDLRFDLQADMRLHVSQTCHPEGIVVDGKTLQVGDELKFSLDATLDSR